MRRSKTLAEAGGARQRKLEYGPSQLPAWLSLISSLIACLGDAMWIPNSVWL